MNRLCILFFGCATAATCGYAQTSSGDMMIGGGLRFSSTSYEDGNVNDRNALSVSPGFGYFINDNLAVGASLAMMSSREGTGPNKTVTSSFGLGPFARYYMFTSNEQFGFFGQAQLEFSTGKTDPFTGDVSRHSAISFSLSPGAAFFFTAHWALEFSVSGFTFTSGNANTNTDGNRYTRVIFGLDSFSPELGFRYHF